MPLGADVLEIGFGDGRFTAQIAQMFPQWQIIGAEVSAASVHRAIRRFRRDSIHNVRVYHGQAGFALCNFVAPASLQRIYVNFPDPWPKAKHEDNRLLQSKFFRQAATRLVDGGSLLLTTDHQEYWQFAQGQGRESGCFSVDTPPPPAHHLTTKYALKWQSQGRSFYHAVFTKHSPGQPWLPHTRYPMPHAIMTGSLPQLKQFEKTVVPVPGGTAVLKDVSRALDGSYYFHTHISEEAIIQDVLLEARSSANGIYVGIGRFGAPLPTEGVKLAVAWLVEWFAAQGLQVVHKSY
jgi:tRNA (guanine-N7-)-methyltransferase